MIALWLHERDTTEFAPLFKWNDWFLAASVLISVSLFYSFSFAPLSSARGKCENQMWSLDCRCALLEAKKKLISGPRKHTLTNPHEHRRRGKEHLNTSFWIIHLGNHNSTALLSNKECQSLFKIRSCSPHFRRFQESQEWEILCAPLFT